MTSHRVSQFGTTVFSEVSKLALERGAVNLGQGFPDFDGPLQVIERAHVAMQDGLNQYARSQGSLELAEAVCIHREAEFDLRYDPLTEAAVFCGATEALMVSMLGLLDPGDEVILFEPVYDSYPAAASMAGVIPVYYTLEAPTFYLDKAKLASLVTPRTKLILLNSPHNPTGRVFSKPELAAVADVAVKHNLIVVADEVYEHLVFSGNQHIPIASLPDMRERTVSISSLGKTWSLTGWKIGWATGPAHLIRGLQAAHQFTTFSVATPLQNAAAFALTEVCHPYLEELKEGYERRRSMLLEALEAAGFVALKPEGSYFVLADFRNLFEGDDLAFAKHLVEKAGIAAIPPSCFYPLQPNAGRHLIRFAFCKKESTLSEAISRLRKLKV